MYCKVLPQPVEQMNYVPEDVKQRAIAAVEADVADEEYIIDVDYEHIRVFDLGKKYAAHYHYWYDTFYCFFADNPEYGNPADYENIHDDFIHDDVREVIFNK